MKKTIKFFITLCASLLVLGSVSMAFAEENTKTVISYTENYNDVYRFINLNEKPDLSKGYIDFVFSDNSQEHLMLDDSTLAPFPVTTKPGLVTYSFEANGRTFSLDFTVVDPDTSLNSFDDIAKSHWGYLKIRNTVSAGFLKGMSSTEFAPSGNMTRAQFCQMIYNIYKDNKSIMTSNMQVSFSDIDPSMWYYVPVNACAEAGIVNGVGDGNFNPLAPISRQDVAVIMMRVLLGSDKLSQVDVAQTLAVARANSIAAKDFELTSEYAKKAVAAALGVIYFGDGEGNITPKNNITRAECASLLSNYLFVGYIAPPIKRLVYLSPSNQMTNPYTGVATNEGAQMQLVAANVQKRLEALGYDVYVADVKTSIKEDAEFNRADEAAKLKADAYVAIHSNAISVTNDGKYQGTICYYNGNNKGARELSQFIYDRLSAFTPTNDNGIHDDIYESQVKGQKPYAEVRLPTMANLIVEVEYHDYTPYAEWITQSIDGIGERIALGIDDYLKTIK